jgi:SAM-dependent methyltransferase
MSPPPPVLPLDPVAPPAAHAEPPLEPEFLDRPDLPYLQTASALADLARVNRLLLGYQPLLSLLLPPLVAATGPGGSSRVLDLGTGSGDVAVRLRDRAARRGVHIRVVGVDRKLRHLLIGRRRGAPRLQVVADAAALPFRRRAFDWSFSTLFFHHFSPEENRRIVAQMRRTAGRGAVVVDLRGGWLLRTLTRLLLPFLGIGRVAYHDGLVSAQRSYTLRGVAAVVEPEAVVELRPRFPCRFGLWLCPEADGERLDRQDGGTAAPVRITGSGDRLARRA